MTMRVIFVISVFVALLAGCDGCPYTRKAYVTIHNQASSDVVVEFRFRTREAAGTSNFDHYFETILPDEVRKIQVDEYTEYDTAKGWADPEWACDDIPDKDWVHNDASQGGPDRKLDFSSATLSGLTICQNSDDKEPFVVREYNASCDAGSERITWGY